MPRPSPGLTTMTLHASFQTVVWPDRADRGNIRQHVSRVRDERERVSQPATDGLGEHVHEGQYESDLQREGPLMRSLIVAVFVRHSLWPKPFTLIPTQNSAGSQREHKADSAAAIVADLNRRVDRR